MKRSCPAMPAYYQQGLEHLWLPYTQMLTSHSPLLAKRTQGTHIILQDDRTLIDGVASWWSACHGYNPPEIVEAATRQFKIMPHVMFGGLVHKPALTLATRLCALFDNKLNCVFFTESGSVSVEVAMKMAIQYQLNKKNYHRTKILCFYGGYHGDTFATMAVCDPEEGMHHLFKEALSQQIIAPLPLTTHAQEECRKLIEEHQEELAGIIIEPCVQGAGGMVFSPPHVLQFLRKMADNYKIALIFDEIFTGFWRTGHCFAFESAKVLPDIITLSKALTGGTVPLAATIAKEEIFDGFLSLNQEHALMHGPTFMANPLACAAANASLDIFKRKNMDHIVRQISSWLSDGLQPCKDLPKVKDVRILGAIGVVELYGKVDCDKLRNAFAQLGAWIRPFRSIVYLTPAFIISRDEITFLCRSIYRVLAEESQS